MAKKLGFKDWIEKYYPVTARSREARADPIRHSLRKWRGLRSAVLERYGLSVNLARLSDGNNKNSLEINDESCVLCVKFLDEMNGCPQCPLTKVLGAPCDCGSESPYRALSLNNDPEPMIKALEKAQRKYGKKEK